VLKSHDEMLDIGRDDLEELLQRAELRAYQRRFGALTCADIMSRNVLTVRADTPLPQAWALLRRHQIKALPVIDGEQRVVGVVTQADFIKLAELDTPERFSAQALAARLRQIVARVRNAGPERVEQIMATAVRSAPATRPIAELVPMFAASGHHHIPILDADQRLVGIITQADLIVALYEQRAHDQLRAAG
jgi:CBS domain-containing membrane protein